MHSDQIVYTGILGSLNIFKKSVNIIHLLSQLKKKNHMIISIDSVKAFGHFQYPFMIKFSKVETRGLFNV